MESWLKATRVARFLALCLQFCGRFGGQLWLKPKVVSQMRAAEASPEKAGASSGGRGALLIPNQTSDKILAFVYIADITRYNDF
jgi:hypothetical protein